MSAELYVLLNLLAMKTEKSPASSDGTGLYQHRLRLCDFLKLSAVKLSTGISWCLGHVLCGTWDIKCFRVTEKNKQACSYLEYLSDFCHISRFSYYRSCYVIFETVTLKDQLDMRAESTGLGVIFLSHNSCDFWLLGNLCELFLPSLERERLPQKVVGNVVEGFGTMSDADMCKL